MNSKHTGDARTGELVLGLDIGSNSVGWALIAIDDGSPTRLRAAGVRAFDAGVEGDISTGRDSSRGVKRREARSRRRLLARRRHRLTKLAKVLQLGGLLPAGDLSSADALVAYFRALDESLFPSEARRENPHLLPYRLRARALDERLEPYEIGRALYHLAHRRGFLSNRRTASKEKDEDAGKVKGGIAALTQAMQDAGKHTLGEYLATLDPELERVRGRYLGRKMLNDEFHLIWAGQLQHHPNVLTEELRQTVQHAIFFQRPLKSVRHLIGECDLEKGQKRAPMASLAAQRFRLLQKVNDLQLYAPDGVRKLTAEERALLVNELEKGDQTFAAIRKLLKAPKGSLFNLETEGEKGLKGNRTAADLREIFGENCWAGMLEEERERVVTELRSIQADDALMRRAKKLWGLDEATAKRLANIALEDGYCSLSRRALAKVLPLMEQGTPFATARKDLYGDEPGPPQVTTLPRLEIALSVRNPAVSRALTEVRKIVNALVREHGQPDRIRIELARDLKKNRKDRKDIHLRNTANRKARTIAADAIKSHFADIGIKEPRRSDTEKWLLWEECGWTCPYTGKQISIEALFGDHPQFDVEHIVPFPRCLDDSFMNKTLCDATENRSHKRNRTPWEAYSHDEARWAEIIARVKQFKGQAARAKLERFELKEVESLNDFSSRQLNDTRYASRLAVEYTGMLYGAGATGTDGAGKKRVEATRGQVTAYLRDQWELNFLGGGEKIRDDHRQHAIDAIVVALTTPAVVTRLSDAAERAPLEHRRRFGRMDPPWEGFLDEIRSAVESLVISHRVARKVATAIHEETIYSKPHKDEDGKDCVHIRKRLEMLKEKDLAAIVDPAIRERVSAKLAELGTHDPGKAFKEAANCPALMSKDGRAIPIRSVRIRVSVSPKPLGGAGAHLRHVKLGSNHHVEILETKDKKGNAKWEGVVVSTYEAMRRLRAHQSVVQRDHGPGKRFLFSLAGGEIIELNKEDSKQDTTKRACSEAGLYVVRTVTATQAGRVSLDFARITDARKKADIQAARDWGRSDIDPLRKRDCRKVTVTPLGEVRRARD